MNADGEVGSVLIAKGLVNYSSKELNRIKRVKDVVPVLGYGDSNRVIENENLVLLV
ncbi:hypothetical protein K7432_017321 [Basidiobolus ranarum]|uniref:PUA domain-containing protein n=1 Tax=Basidiobolus ranarum TaxID=34480 RepID=A0ABR2VKJ0_9FUNG